jgi:hypothetical protein
MSTSAETSREMERLDPWARERGRTKSQAVRAVFRYIVAGRSKWFVFKVSHLESQ